MQHLRQPKGSNLCGQACVAMLLGVTLDEAVLEVGSKGKTRTRDLLKAIGHLTEDSKLVPVRQRAMPPRCLCRLVRGKLGHWVIVWDNLAFDPDLDQAYDLATWEEYMTSLGARVTSTLELTRRGMGKKEALNNTESYLKEYFKGVVKERNDVRTALSIILEDPRYGLGGALDFMMRASIHPTVKRAILGKLLGHAAVVALRGLLREYHDPEILDELLGQVIEGEIGYLEYQAGLDVAKGLPPTPPGIQPLDIQRLEEELAIVIAERRLARLGL